MGLPIQLLTFNLNKKPQTLLCMIPGWKQRKYTPRPHICQGWHSLLALLQARPLPFTSILLILKLSISELHLRNSASLQNPNRALLFYTSGASLLEDKAQENSSM